MLQWAILLSAASVVSALAVGCSGDVFVNVRCGPGTALQDDTCVVADGGPADSRESPDLGVDALPGDDTFVTPEATPDAESETPPPLPGCGAVGSLVNGPQVLIDLFVLPDAIVVVRADAVLLVGRDGATKKSVTWPRTVTMAALDDDGTLVVADKAAVTTMGTKDLAVGIEFFTSETCVAGAIISKSRFVCGPGNDWDRVFYTYDLKTGTLLAKSKPYTYNGIPTRRVPGYDDLVTVDDELSPTDFFLYTTSGSGEVTGVSDSPYHGDFPVTALYAFHVPDDRVVTQNGLFLKIHSPGCSPTGTGCFVKDGDLGTLGTKERFVAMTDDGLDTIYGVVGSSDTWPDFSHCKSGCRVEKIDAAKRAILSEKKTVLSDFSSRLGRAGILRLDPKCKTLLLGYLVEAASDPYLAGGYRIVNLAF